VFSILSQWNTSYVPTPEPTTEPTVLALEEDVVSGTQVHPLPCTFFEPSKIMDFPVSLSKRCTGEHTVVKKFASIEVRRVFIGAS
jgi:hypothetical protein